MDQVKLDNFSNEYPGRDFPRYVSLSEVACSNLARAIKHKFALETSSNGLALVRAIDGLARPCKVAARVGDAFDLHAFLGACAIVAADFLYINWYRYDKIDKLKQCDLAEYFYDIWYQDVDDIDIFDDSIDWILSVRHDGLIKLLR